MLVQKNNLGFGYRSWRYAALIDDCKVLESFIEPGFEDNYEEILTRCPLLKISKIFKGKLKGCDIKAYRVIFDY